MSINGKRDNFTQEDFIAVAELAGIKNSLAKQVIEEVSKSVGRWPEFAKQAKQAKVDNQFADFIDGCHRTKIG